jgi:hypothetical protein
MLLHRFNAHDGAIGPIDSRGERDFAIFDGGCDAHDLKLPQSSLKDKSALTSNKYRKG